VLTANHEPHDLKGLPSIRWSGRAAAAIRLPDGSAGGKAPVTVSSPTWRAASTAASAGDQAAEWCRAADAAARARRRPRRLSADAVRQIVREESAKQQEAVAVQVAAAGRQLAPAPTASSGATPHHRRESTS